MKTIKSLLYITIIGISLASSCRNDDDTPPPPEPILVDTSLVVEKPWKLFSVYYVDNNGKQDFSSFIHPCEWDNLLYFHRDGSVTVEEGALACDSTDAIFTKGGSWMIDRESKILTITNDSDVQTFSISKLNDTCMTVFGKVKANPLVVDAEVTFIEDRP